MQLQFARSRKLRSRQTKHEKILWSQIRKRQLNGFKFRRQHCIAGYIAEVEKSVELVVERIRQEL